MSSEKVTRFLGEKRAFEIKNERKKMALLRYKVLSHYDLGEMVYYKDGDNIDDFPLTDYEKGETTGKCRYDCNISDEDFEKVLSFYNKEIESTNKSEGGIDNSAEGIVKTFASVALIAGIIAFVVTLIVAFSAEEWPLIGTGLGLLIVGLFAYAFTKVFVNISYKLDKIANLLNKSE